jgi:hypothetical protein
MSVDPSEAGSWSFRPEKVGVPSRFQSAASSPESAPFGARPQEKPGGGRGAPPPSPKPNSSRCSSVSSYSSICPPSSTRSFEEKVAQSFGPSSPDSETVLPSWLRRNQPLRS